MRVLSRLAVWVVGACLATGCGESATEVAPALAQGRPEGASQGPAAAIVVVVRGEVKVKPAQGDAFAARPELQLLRDDTISTAPDSLVIVQLHNGQLVRMTPGGTLRVDAMAGFDGPPASDDLEQRFARLLSAQEREDATLRGAITRVAGWNMRMSAAQTIAPQSAPRPISEGAQPLEAPASEAPAELRDEPTSTPGSPPSPTQLGSAQDEDSLADPVVKAKPRPRPADAPRPDAKPTPPRVPEPFGGSAPESSPGDDVGASQGKKSSTSPALDLPSVASFRPDDGGKSLKIGLPGAMLAVRAELARCAGAGAKIRARVVGKKITELQISGQPSKCVDLIGKPVAQPDGWIELQVAP